MRCRIKCFGFDQYLVHAIEGYLWWKRERYIGKFKSYEDAYQQARNFLRGQGHKIGTTWELR